MNAPDASNMGRCDICGEPIDIRDGGDTLVIQAEEDFDIETEYGIPVEEVVDGMARALERSDNPKDDLVAEALREESGYRLHRRCYDETSMPNWPSVEEEMEGSE